MSLKSYYRLDCRITKTFIKLWSLEHLCVDSVFTPNKAAWMACTLWSPCTHKLKLVETVQLCTQNTYEMTVTAAGHNIIFKILFLSLIENYRNYYPHTSNKKQTNFSLISKSSIISKTLALKQKALWSRYLGWTEKKKTTSVSPERCKTIDTAGCHLNRRLLVMNMCCTGIKGYFILQGARTIIDINLIILNKKKVCLVLVARKALVD